MDNYNACCPTSITTMIIQGTVENAPPSNEDGFLTKENNEYILLEDGNKIKLE